MERVTFAIRENLGDVIIETKAWYISAKAPWYARFGWWLSRKSLQPFSYPVPQYTWVGSEKLHVDEAIIECMNNTGYEAHVHPEWFVFVCGYEFFDRLLARKGIEHTLNMPHGRLMYNRNGIRVDVKVVPSIDGYALIRKEDLR